MARPVRDRIGEIYGHWKVISYDIEKTQETKKHYWVCECDCGCGTQKSIRGDYLSTIKIGGCNNMLNIGKPRVCLKCKKEFFPIKNANNRKYCYDCVPEINYSGNTIRRYLKIWGLEYKGNQCSICGYNKCKQALDFHHLDESQKDFTISNHSDRIDWPTLKKELDKCIVVCANCHREIHNDEFEFLE